MMSKKHNSICMTLNCIKHLLICITGCVSISYFASLVGFSFKIMSSAVGLNICAIFFFQEK